MRRRPPRSVTEHPTTGSGGKAIQAMKRGQATAFKSPTPPDDDRFVTAPDPHAAYCSHVAACRACRKCGSDALNLADGGFADHPSPWAMWMGALTDVDVVIVGQDFRRRSSHTSVPIPRCPRT
jgi:hypothetical protein